MQVTQNLNDLSEIVRQLDRLIPTLETQDECHGGKYWLTGQFLDRAKKKLPYGQFNPFKKQLALKHGKAVRTLDYALQVYKGEPDYEKAKRKTVRHLIHTAQEGRRKLREECQNRPLSLGVRDERILHGDSLDWLRSQAAESIPFFVSDPPYGIGMEYDGWTEPADPDAYWQWFAPYWSEMVRTLIPGGTIVLFHSCKYLFHFGEWFPNCRIIACCHHTKTGCRFWEPIVWWSKGDPIRRLAGINDWIVPGASLKTHHSSHPCVKSEALALLVVRRYTRPEALVVDPFCGTGTIPLACKTLGRKYVGIERSERYAAEARARLAK